MTEDESTVRVAVRIRPQLPREVIDMCRVCTNVTPGEPQVTLGSDKAFTYDYVFDTPSTQSAIYETCSRTLVQGSLEGYNATVLAYGQTGSGKTYTMGTGFDVDVTSEQVGIIPRAIHHIFSGIDEISEAAREAGEPPPQFKVTAQFLELYNEEIIDLFDPTQDYSSGKGKSGIRIHEDSNHCIYVTGVQSLRVSNAEEALQLLRQGALSRTTASTQMNSQSSRSHAIFTLHIKQQRLVKMEPEEIEDNLDSERGQQEFETLTAKFHFVDLAGSERLKRTGATGERAKEGISINCGLLALGNVISALGDTSKRVLHVPYRDSKLTRLLQDSLGGNSRTLMIACISPSDRDFMETLNTLKYANRARNIQNKVIINQDKSSRTITILKKEIQQLQLELLEYKQGKRIINPDGSESINDMFHENTLLQNEAENLRMRVKAMQETIDTLSAKNTELLAEKATSAWINCDAKNDGGMSEIIKKYVTEIEELRAKVFESESICTQLRKAMSRNNKLLGSPSKGDSSGGIDPGVDSLIELAKKDLQKDYEVLAKSRQSGGTGSDNSESESESNSSESEEDNEYSKEIANLTSEISVKQRLIDELEKAQKRLNSMKQHYEDKLNQLQAKIQATQQERDTVLASFTENKQPTEKVKKIKDEYERKLTDMQKEMKSLQSAKREHAKLLRNQSQYETQIRTLNSEVMDMKKAKVKLIAKMREEAARHKEAESRRNREIAQLRKQSRLDANLIRNLEAEKRAKAAILKRKQEEVSALRKVARNRSQLNNNITMRKRRALKNPNQKWIAVEKIISENTMNRQSIIMLEREMERQIESRTELQEELKSKMALCKDPNYQQSSVLKEEIDTLRESLDHVQATITDLQQEILQVEENKISFEAADLLEGIKDFSGAAYMVDKLYNMTLNHSNLVAQKDVAVRELQAEIEQLKRQTEMQNQLLEHLLERNNKFRNDNKTSPGHSGPDSNKTSRSNSPTDKKNTVISSKVSGNWDPPKYRRRTALPQELLFPVDMPPQETQSALASPELMPPPPPLTRSLTSIKIHSVPASPVTMRKGHSVSPHSNRKTYIISSNHPSMEQGLDGSPPNSPPVFRRQLSKGNSGGGGTTTVPGNVFSRLTSQTNSNRTSGTVTQYIARKAQKGPLQCSYYVQGHSTAVLALHATDEILFTASRDKNVVMWDLNELKEVQVFGDHPNNVVAVKYDPINMLMFSASASYVKVWDIKSSKCVRVLSSTGVCISGSSQLGNTGTSMTDIAINNYNYPKHCYLYTAHGDKVGIWDLRRFSTTGKLLGGHQAAVMCIALARSDSHDVVVTGSKDHYIKVFDVFNTSASNFPRVTLEPPHYDGIQCLAIAGNTLFSGSRDCIIKKWNLDSNDLVTSITGAHKDWVTGLTFVPGQPFLISGCRDGSIKLWSTETCLQLGEMKAHNSSINAIATNNSFVFTASSSGDVKMWKHPAQHQDIMTMSTGHIFQLSV